MKTMGVFIFSISTGYEFLRFLSKQAREFGYKSWEKRRCAICAVNEASLGYQIPSSVIS
jgi:hypothetical protein